MLHCAMRAPDARWTPMRPQWSYPDRDVPASDEARTLRIVAHDKTMTIDSASDDRTERRRRTKLRPAALTVSETERRLLVLGFFLVSFGFLIYQFLRVLSPFFPSLLGAVMLVLIFQPWYRWLVRRSGRPGIAAGIACTTALTVLVLPVFLLTWRLATEATALIPVAREWAAGVSTLTPEDLVARLPGFLERAGRSLVERLPEGETGMQSLVLSVTRDFIKNLTGLGTTTLKGGVLLFFDAIVLVLATFYFFREGQRLLAGVTALLPMAPANTKLIVRTLDRTISAIIRGGFITASVQGFLTGVGLGVAGVPFTVTLSVTAALLSVMPIVGAGLVWIPAAIYLFVDGQTVAAIGVFVWGAAVVSVVDNFLRPYVVGEHAGLPILLLIVSILGGLQVYGVTGALFGPLLIALLLAFIDIYRVSSEPTPPPRSEEDAATDPPSPA